MKLFEKIPVKKLKRSPFDLSHPVKFSCEFGQQQVTCFEKCVPGDTVLYAHLQKTDFAPLVSKNLQEYRIKQESFFVPTRILWKKFEQFFVAEDTSIIHPYIRVFSIYDQVWQRLGELFADTPSEQADAICQILIGPRSLLWSLYGNVLGLFHNKTVSVDDEHADALRLYAYLRVMVEYYFDENLDADPIEFLSEENFNEYYVQDSGNMTNYFADWFANYIYYLFDGVWLDSEWSSETTVLDPADADEMNRIKFYMRGFVLRNYPKDYLVGSLPWKQKGDTVMIPQSSEQDVRFYVQNEHETSDTILSAPVNYLRFQNNGNNAPSGYKAVNPVASKMADTTKNSYMIAKTVIGAGVTSIEDFRTAYQLQQWLEKNARGGTRYKEQILSHFGIHTKDSRLDRPEFLLGTTDVVNHGDVYTTYQDEQGNGVPAESVTRLQAAGSSRRIGYHVTEHGYFFSMYCIFPKANYAQGIFRQAMELDKFDYFWPEFEHLGEQEVFRCEVDSQSANPKSVFGYVPRYSQYKCRMPIVRGDFVDNLKSFTLYRDLPLGSSLNHLFVAIDPYRNNLNRSFNVINAEYDKIYPEVYHNLWMYRPMSYYGTPRLVL